jgi:hypothetical protein
MLELQWGKRENLVEEAKGAKDEVKVSNAPTAVCWFLEIKQSELPVGSHLLIQAWQEN